MKPRAFQDEMEGNYCWGCGPTNEHGLRIKSYWAGEEAVATWHPMGYHSAGPRDVLNGGIIASLIDCHSVCTAIAAAYQAEGREIGTAPSIWCVTAALKVDYLRPTPIDRTVTLRAKVTEQKGRKTIVNCSLFSGEEECARGEILAVRVSPSSLKAE